jgi:hypothetical protein
VRRAFTPRLRDHSQPFAAAGGDGEAALVMGPLVRKKTSERLAEVRQLHHEDPVTTGLIAQAWIEEPVKASRSAAERGER